MFYTILAILNKIAKKKENPIKEEQKKTVAKAWLCALHLKLYQKTTGTYLKKKNIYI